MRLSCVCNHVVLIRVGKLPVEVDMDWTPQNAETSVVESPPPIPPKMTEITSFDVLQNVPALGLCQSANPKMQNDDLAPVLPPKPKYVCADNANSNFDHQWFDM